MNYNNIFYESGFICFWLGHPASAGMTLALLLPMNFCQNSLAQGIKAIDDELSKLKSDSISLPDGSILIGKNPKRGTEAYRHIIFSAQSEDELLDWLNKERIKASSIVSFYKISNGASFFDDQIAIYGKQSLLRRDPSKGMSPYDLNQSNNENRRLVSDSNFKLIGRIRGMYECGDVLIAINEEEQVKFISKSTSLIVYAAKGFNQALSFAAEHISSKKQLLECQT